MWKDGKTDCPRCGEMYTPGGGHVCKTKSSRSPAGYNSGVAMSFPDEMKKQQEKEAALRAVWALGEYDNPSEGCPNCSRQRLCKCSNGKHRCEKCNWVPEDEAYCPVGL